MRCRCRGVFLAVESGQIGADIQPEQVLDEQSVSGQAELGVPRQGLHRLPVPRADHPRRQVRARQGGAQSRTELHPGQLRFPCAHGEVFGELPVVRTSPDESRRAWLYLAYDFGRVSRALRYPYG
ncbi:hypothetical protein EVAR_17966_1 [Eumeta japonica]|uniref:Uncharacterized protein n=1 Tax=Eumeta variegata TaxID=151549 RepID=A0A4C1UYC7_EUMVA|nr:hypothetical protein EVAR_17966_1 [Eumeta japonica]